MFSRFLRYSVMLLAVTLLLAACAGDARNDTPAEQATEVVEAKEEVVEAQEEAVDALSLAGTYWKLEFIGEPSDDLPVLPETRPTVAYAVDRYGGFGGCNYFLGVYTADASSLRMNTPASTMSGCEPPEVMSQEGTFSSALVNTTEYKMEGANLVMYTVGEQRMLTMSPAEAPPFEGTTWELKFVWDESYWAPTLIDSKPTAIFAGDQMSGSGGCNTYSATVTLTENRMVIGPAASTMMACAEPEGVMEQESVYFTTLESVAGYEQLGDLLLLLSGEGYPILAFGAVVE